MEGRKRECNTVSHDWSITYSQSEECLLGCLNSRLEIKITSVARYNLYCFWEWCKLKDSIPVDLRRRVKMIAQLLHTLFKSHLHYIIQIKTSLV